MADNSQLQTNGLQKLKAILNNSTMQQNFKNILAENAGPFMASIIELYQSDNTLRDCDPNKVILEALKAATLKLPINKQLGFAWIIPYKDGGVPIPQFQIGYKGYIQLAMRTALYKHINAGFVYKGERVVYDRITGMMAIEGEASSEEAVGYFAYFKLLNGFEKAIYWTKERVTSHAKRYSKSWKKENSPWHTEFDAMALKTVLRNILSKYGVMSIEFANAIANDADEAVDAEIKGNANQEAVTLPPSPAFIEGKMEEAPEEAQGEGEAEPQQEKDTANEFAAVPGF
jgi:recombination protein RecT